MVCFNNNEDFLHMIAQLIDKGTYYICSEFRMKQRELGETCWFCGKVFTNYEEELIKTFKLEDE